MPYFAKFKLDNQTLHAFHLDIVRQVLNRKL